MHIVVLLKQTFDTEEKVAVHGGQVSEDGVKFIINPYDEYAVEEAIRQKERHGGTVTVVSVGPERAAEALRTALAMGADEAVLISGEGTLTDSRGISLMIAAALGRLPKADVILGGLFSVDQGAGQTAIRVAGLLGLPHVSSITQLDIDSAAGVAVVLRDAEGDAETLEVTLPAVFTAQQGLNEPRYPSLPGIMKAKKKPFHRLSLQDLGLTVEAVAARTERLSLALPSARGAGKRLAGDPQAQAAQLVHLLRTEAKVL
ncbi:electron transfer flavoprotein subunit beta/FixA family protein [Paenibacillus cremeus]|uniref:Electron transfer flavoprotein subunit beta n=1 Tax=Paenibacillus cremeus TaxID=2163881 RepID=A0A559KIN9_9BACL|nr:electron transfer flavoprotein subunit beta/FixA family protein [Paenibacillus cremeus]TVY11992.1 electron transfer flavoprotein subunit beta/FixA family protein [Paenibacillus cremeus]